MQLSTHYYVLSIATASSVLFEAFRDSLIEVENHGFPIPGPPVPPGGLGRAEKRELARTVDDSFGRYHALDPLNVVLVGDAEFRADFRAATAHGAAIIGWVDGDHTTTSVRDLGQIVWPIVKEAMSGVLDRALRDLEESAARGELASGLEAVVRAMSDRGGATLLVEDDYHLRGSISGDSDLSMITASVDVRDVIDDVVDAVIERVFASEGNVVFLPPGTLQDRERIVLLPQGALTGDTERKQGRETP